MPAADNGEDRLVGERGAHIVGAARKLGERRRDIERGERPAGGRDRVRVTATTAGLALACSVEVTWTSLFEDGFESGGLAHWSAH